LPAGELFRHFRNKEKYKGTGPGLSVVHGIIENHGGGITVESQVGEGTVVHVFLPTTDDEKDLVDIGCQMLDILGYDATGVVGSVEALETFK
jgi:hypothetical protein